MRVVFYHLNYTSILLSHDLIKALDLEISFAARENYDISTFYLTGSCSAFELPGKKKDILLRYQGSNLGQLSYQNSTLPLSYTSILHVCKDSNPDEKFWRLLCYQLHHKRVLRKKRESNPQGLSGSTIFKIAAITNLLVLPFY